MASGYHQGRLVEWEVVHDLTDHGYDCTRAASSKGAADVIAIKPGQILLVSVKRTDPLLPRDERAKLLRVAAHLSPASLPVVAYRPIRQPLRYRLLTGPGPKQWQDWTPDPIAQENQP